MIAANRNDRWLSVYTTLLAILAGAKGVRLPNLWAATQAQVDYAVGFTKRGLVGEIATVLHIPLWHYGVFIVYAYSVLILSLFLLALLIMRSFYDAEFRSVVLVFLSSMAITFLVHLVGYLEGLLLLLTLVALGADRSTAAFFVEILVCFISPFIHEMFLLSFFPVILFRVTFDATQTSGREQALLILRAVSLIMIVASVMIFIAQSKPMTADNIASLMGGMKSRVDFPIRLDFFDVMQRSLADNIRAARAGAKLIDQVIAVLSLGWVTLFFICCTIWRVYANALSHKRLVCVFVIFASIAPMFLQVVGWDLCRWYALSVFSSFLVYTTVVLRSKCAGQNLNPYFLSALVAVNLCTGTGLLDGYRINTFPYIENLSGVIRDYQRNGTFRLPAT